MGVEALSDLREAIQSDDTAAAAIALSDVAVRERINNALFDWGMPALGGARSEAMMDLLLAHGADVDAVSRWWGSGMGVIETIAPITGVRLISRGAVATVHAAAAMGLSGVLLELIRKDPGCVTARGGDGCHPLHFARTPAVANILLDHDADIDARDEDHASTPLQWRIRDHRDVCRLLIDRGATLDIFAVAALGDTDLAVSVVQNDPACVTYRIGYNSGPVPGIGFKGRGGTIYQWTLGFNLSPHEVARKNKHEDIYELLWNQSPVKTRFLVACTLADRATAESIVSDHPDIVSTLNEEDLTLPAKWCWETNSNIEAVRLMLDLGFPVDTPECNHGYTPLHNAAFSGDADMVALLLERGHPADIKDPENDSTPVGWAIHGCIEARRHPEGDYGRTVDLLLKSGAPFPRKYPTGDAAIDRVLAEHNNGAHGGI